MVLFKQKLNLCPGWNTDCGLHPGPRLPPERTTELEGGAGGRWALGSANQPWIGGGARETAAVGSCATGCVSAVRSGCSVEMQTDGV